jgi:hypothetical protein
MLEVLLWKQPYAPVFPFFGFEPATAGASTGFLRFLLLVVEPAAPPIICKEAKW